MLPSPTLRDLRRLAGEADALGLSPKARERLGWLLHYCEHGCSVTVTCRHFGIPRMTFYRMFDRFRAGNPSTLEDRPRHPPRTARLKLARSPRRGPDPHGLPGPTGPAPVASRSWILLGVAI